MRIGRRQTGADGGVIGLAHRAGAWWLVALERRGDGAARKVHQAQADASFGGLATVWPKLTAGLGEDAKRWPVAWVLPAGRALHRRVELPATDDTTTAKLVAVQAEAWLPGRGDEAFYGWSREEASGASAASWRWVTAVPREAVEPMTRAWEAVADGAGPLASAVSDATALAAGAVEGNADASWIIAPDGAQTTVVLASGKGLDAVAHVDGTADTGEAPWLADLTDAVSARGDAPGGPVPVAWVGSSRDPGRCEGWALALGVGTSRVVDESLGTLLARGAALAALGGRGPVVVLDDAAGGSTGRPLPVKAWAAAGVALAAALGLWAWADIHAASVIGTARDGHPTLATRQAELRRQLDLYEFLEDRPPTMLAMLDEFTDKATGFNPQVMHYDADGDLELTGTLGSSNAIGKFVAELADMRTLASAQLRSQKNEGRDQVAYEIVATPATNFYEAFVPQPKPEPDSEKGSDEPTDAGPAVTGDDVPDQPGSGNETPADAEQADDGAGAGGEPEPPRARGGGGRPSPEQMREFRERREQGRRERGGGGGRERSSDRGGGRDRAPSATETVTDTSEGGAP